MAGSKSFFHILQKRKKCSIMESNSIKRQDIRFSPDPKRVIARFFFPGPEERVTSIIQKVLKMPDDAAKLMLNQTLREFSNRHRNISRIFQKHFNHVRHIIIRQIKINPDDISETKSLLIGAYFTSEYSIESAAFFNPSMVEDPDQTNLDAGEKRVIVSFRATGEGHISSIVFRNGVVNNEGRIRFNPSGRLVDEAEAINNSIYDKNTFLKKLSEMNVHKKIIHEVFNRLGDTFDYQQLENSIRETKEIQDLSVSKKNVLDAVMWLANSHYEISFSMDTDISQRVIFPIAAAESNGIEDARFVRFQEDDGSIKYYATYTAYNGFTILPKLIVTEDFYTFKVMPLHGEYAQNKGMALFPRKIKGKYAMVSRLDGINNYIMFSDHINIWENASILQQPKHPWEFIQIGNSGSPIETDEGWLLITHGVGTMRKYCLGAVLLDKEDPTRIIAELPEPLLMPNEKEREGYVPNVVYSCGSILHNGRVIIPYAMSDTSSTVASIKLSDLWQKMKAISNVVFKSNGQEKILLVDDDPVMQRVLAELLRNENYEVDVAGDGINALMNLAWKEYDIVLSDVQMPNYDGFQLLEFMKSKGIDVPVVFITGSSDENLELKALQLGAVEFLKKPVDPELLILRMKNLIKTHKKN